MLTTKSWILLWLQCFLLHFCKSKSLPDNQNRAVAYIPKTSFDKYLDFLELYCNDYTGPDISDITIHTLDNGYFDWESYHFKQSLLKVLYPETSNGDFKSIYKSPVLVYLDRVFSPPEIMNNCTIQELEEPEPNEALNFQDAIINYVFVAAHTPHKVTHRSSDAKKRDKKWVTVTVGDNIGSIV